MTKPYITFSKDEKKDKDIKKTIYCIVMVTISTIIYSFGIVWFITPAALYSGGVTGIAQLINRLLIVLGVPDELFLNDTGILVFLLNIPILIYGWKAVSKRFVICSIISIAIQTIMLSNLVSKYLFLDLGINTSGTEAHRILLAFIGGFVCGFGAALALRSGTSTGGIDVLAQALAFKKHISIGYTSLIVNVTIALLGAIIIKDPTVLFYTIVRIISQSVVTDRVHTAYNFLKVEIITLHGQEIADKIMADLHRGVTIMPGVGAYTGQNKDVVETIVSSYEINKVISDAKSVDPSIFVSVVPVKSLFGKFERKTIA